MRTITADAPRTHPPVAQQVDQSIQNRLGQCPYAFVFYKVRWEFRAGQLILNGSVPSFYLKQMLPELLRDLDHVQEIQNLVDVVSCNGLSSVRRTPK